MSPKKQPATLNVFCLKWLSNQLINALSDEEVKHLDEVQVYMNSATYDVLQALLGEILGMINLDANIRFSCLQVLLRPDVKHLEIGIFPRFYYDQILTTIRKQGKGLNYLNLKGVWARDYSQLLGDLVLGLQRLRTLIIPHMSDDSVINTILSLKGLVKLDISGEACYSSAAIRLLRSDSLRILDIGSFGKPELCPDGTNGPELVAEIIQQLPNLNVLKTYSFTGHALLHLFKKDDNFRTKLTYLHTTDCDVNILNAITWTAPFLDNAHFNCPQERVVSGLGQIKHLHALKLTRGDFTHKRKAEENGKTDIVCYYASWAVYRVNQGQFTTDKIDPTLCTKIVYSFAGLNIDLQKSKVSVWLENGLPSGKLILGVPTYARCFNLLDNEEHGIGAAVDKTTCGGQWTDEDGFLSFYEVQEYLSIGICQGSEISDDSVYAWCSDMWMTYDNEETVASKTKYVLESGLGGIMVWSIDTDDFLGLHGNKFSLLSSIYRTINEG
ncbi:hypothetical protein HUJ05_011505 [Dendroctonus ponderosae]|nr:hypothetical protein HUJ05_011505 [Dendroctonus ponderosae]